MLQEFQLLKSTMAKIQITPLKILLKFRDFHDWEMLYEITPLKISILATQRVKLQ